MPLLRRLQRFVPGCLYVSNVCLLGWCTTRTHFLHCHHHLNHVHVGDNFDNLRWSHRGGQRHDITTFNVGIAQHIRQLDRIHGDNFFRSGKVNAITRDKMVDQVKLADGFTIQFSDRAIDYFDGWFGIIRAFHRNEAFFDPLLNKTV